MINVNELSNGKLQIEWDENDPIESILNNWSEEDFQKFFDECLRQDSGEFEEESGETSGISEATQEDTEDFWYNELPKEDDITKEGY